VARKREPSVFFDREKHCFVGLDAEKLKHLKQAYERIDVDSELNKMGLWLSSPRGSKRKGNGGFIMNWLNNCTPAEPKPIPREETETPMRPLLNQYLKELWKGREHLLELNKRAI